MTENELQYFEAFISHIGTAGRYQFLAEYLQGQEIPHLSGIKIPAVRGNFGKYAYYSFVISARHLLKIAYVNHQALNHPDGRPAYQRMINKNRIKDIGSFIQAGGFFPTNILVNFSETCRFDLLPNKENTDRSIKFGWLYLPSKYKSAWIIDGQHRLYGFSNIPDQFLDTNLFVLAFEKMDNKTEADLFITINHEQRSVSKSLLVTLQADLKLGAGDPKEALGALASALVRSMNNDNTSPFFRRFETPGVTPQETQNLTVAEAVKGLLRSNLLGRVLPKKTKAVGFLSAQTDHDSIIKARKILNGYFRGIMEANIVRWQRGRTAYICVNPGIRAQLLLIQEALHYLSGRGDIDVATEAPEKLAGSLVQFVEPIRDFFAKATDADVEIRFSRKFGEGGVLEYYYNLCEILNRKHKEFGSEEFKNYKARQADARIQKADQDITDIQGAVSTVVIETLKKLHGVGELPSGEKAYWDLGIENAEVKQSAYATMSSECIADMPIASMTADPAHLYLWCPNALLPEGLAVMKAWGFAYKSNLIWHKVRKDGGSDGRGVGFYFRNVTELILFGVKGKNARTLAPGRRQVNLLATRKREHSRKPDEQYDIIEACSPGPFLELFARGTRKNWITWGHQADDDYRPTWKTYANHSRAAFPVAAE